jgi:hypothetical protein
MDVSEIQGQDANGQTQATVAVRWSSNAETGERFVDIRVDELMARLTQTRDGAFVWQGQDGFRESSVSRTVAERVAADLGSKAAGASAQSVRPLGLAAGGNLELANPAWVDDVSACMKSLLEDFPGAYVGAHAICFGRHGPR